MFWQVQLYIKKTKNHVFIFLILLCTRRIFHFISGPFGMVVLASIRIPLPVLLALTDLLEQRNRAGDLYTCLSCFRYYIQLFSLFIWIWLVFIQASQFIWTSLPFYFKWFIFISVSLSNSLYNGTFLFVWSELLHRVSAICNSTSVTRFPDAHHSSRTSWSGPLVSLRGSGEVRWPHFCCEDRSPIEYNSTANVSF
jgi:hypothetical protein